ncbi:MAG: hypothetical protein ACE5EY_02400, partial [Anaerolineae bacterium]
MSNLHPCLDAVYENSEVVWCEDDKDCRVKDAGVCWAECQSGRLSKYYGIYRAIYKLLTGAGELQPFDLSL